MAGFRLRRILAAMVNGTPGNAAPAGSVSAGTHLVREWNGRTYQVEVVDTPQKDAGGGPLTGPYGGGKEATRETRIEAEATAA